MKIIQILILLLLASCNTATQQKINALEAGLQKYHIELKDGAMAADKRNLPLFITWINTIPNSAGGAGVAMTFITLSNPPIKYISFHVIPYNRVKDKVASEVGGKVDAYLQGTGPFSRNTENEIRLDWENVWYNSTIECAVIEDIKITLMDGTVKTYSGNDFEDIFLNSYALSDSVSGNYSTKSKQKSCKS
ncbi:MAG: hypothetical protein Q7T96_00950 [Methylobacter sp.]|nr:hypothetical protein [Methylobacter sp.]